MDTYPGSTIHPTLIGAPVGLVGTLTVAVVNEAAAPATDLVAATTAGIVEFAQGDGTSNYQATVVIPGDATPSGASADYAIVWDNAGTTAAEDLTILPSPTSAVTPQRPGAVANSRYYYKTGDTAPPIANTAQDDLGRVVDIAGATVKFHMDTPTPIDVAANNDQNGDGSDGSKGALSYDLQPADLVTAGRYRAEFEVTFADGGVETFPQNGYITVIVSEAVAP